MNMMHDTASSVCGKVFRVVFEIDYMYFVFVFQIQQKNLYLDN